MDRVENLLMTYKEYGKKAMTPGKSYPFEIESNGQILYYIGVAHIYYFKDEQVDGLRNKFKEFIQRASGHSRIVLTEGGIRPVASGEEEAMKAGGEPNLVTYWATKENIEVFSPEPDRQEEANHLLEQFSKDEVMHYYFARQVNHWNLMKRPESLEAHVERALKRYQDAIEWKDYDFSLENMRRIHQEITGQKFNPDDWELFQNLSDPRKDIAVTNRVCAESSKFRDVHIVSEILRLWKEKKDIFVVYGRTHAIMQEPALIQLIK